jgi:hypothetical protein
MDSPTWDSGYFEQCSRHIQALLAQVPGLSANRRREVAEWVYRVAEAADRLGHHFRRLMTERLPATELGELFISIGLTIDDFQGPAGVVEKTLYEIGAALRGPHETEPD